MSVLPKLSTSLGRRDEVPNQQLASEIATAEDHGAIRELVENLGNMNKNIQSDCIKVLYEIGEKNASLIANYDKEFLSLLDNTNNRLVWGAMTALDYITSVNPKGIYKKLGKILEVAKKGSVITVDHAVNIIIQLAGIKLYSETCLVLLHDQMKDCATNQLPKYAEDAVPVITPEYTKVFVKVLNSRIPDMDKASKKKRLEKVIKKLST